MIDGPYRTLHLPRHWKKVAEYAETPSYSSEEIESALKAALRKDVPQSDLKQIRRLAANSCQEKLFPCGPLGQIKSEQKELGCSPLGRSLQKWVIIYAGPGKQPSVAAKLTLFSALEEHAQAMIYAIEEHYLAELERGKPPGEPISKRLQEAYQGIEFQDLASSLLYSSTEKPIVKPPTRRADLDYGPRLPVRIASPPVR